MNTKKSIKILLLLALFTSLYSCKTRLRYNTKFNYFQKGLDSNLVVKPFAEYTLKPNDLISIQVVAGSNDQRDVLPYNSPISEMGIKTLVTQNSTMNGASFLIDSLGFLNYPKIGKINVNGLTKSRLAEIIKEKISDEVFKPYVVVKLNQFKINVLGEVKVPGIQSYKTEKVNILDAISEAGDLTDFAKRNEIVLLRETNGKYQTFNIDLTTADFIKSDAFMLQNNDVIYVAANMQKLKTLNINPNFQRDLNLVTLTLNSIAILLTAYNILRR